jgi:hypothetical protein
MVAQVVFDEGADEVVAVVIARVAAQREGLAGFGASGLEQVGVQSAGVPRWRVGPWSLWTCASSHGCKNLAAGGFAPRPPWGVCVGHRLCACLRLQGVKG